jgi:DNA-directed RNA polymerase subunit E'/Rpb7
MSSSTESKKPRSLTRRKKKEQDLYTPTILTRRIQIPIINVGTGLINTLLTVIRHEISGKCTTEGYIKPNSLSILTYSNGVIDGANVQFEVVAEGLVCNPVEGQHLTCLVKNVTKAGIRAELSDENNPLVIFVARDHNYSSKYFSTIQENQEITVRVIGQRFELNDLYVSVIAELIEPRSRSKPKIKVAETIAEISVPVIPLQEVSPPAAALVAASPSVAASVAASPSVAASVAASPSVAASVAASEAALEAALEAASPSVQLPDLAASVAPPTNA